MFIYLYYTYNVFRLYTCFNNNFILTHIQYYTKHIHITILFDNNVEYLNITYVYVCILLNITLYNNNNMYL